MGYLAELVHELDEALVAKILKSLDNVYKYSGNCCFLFRIPQQKAVDVLCNV